MGLLLLSNVLARNDAARTYFTYKVWPWTTSHLIGVPWQDNMPFFCIACDISEHCGMAMTNRRWVIWSKGIYIDTYAMHIKHSPRRTTSWRGDQLSNVVSRACAQRCSSDVNDVRRLFVKQTYLNGDANKKRGCLCDICMACDISEDCGVEIKLVGQIGSWVMS